MISILLSSNVNVPGSSATTYCPIQASTGSTWLPEALCENVIPISGTFDNFRASVNTAPGSGKSFAFTLRKNEAATALTATIADTNTLASDLVNSVAVTAGDRLSLQSVTTSTPTNPGLITWTMRFTTTGASQSFLLANTLTQTIAASTQYLTVQGDGVMAAAEAGRQCVMPTGGTISSLYLGVTVAPGGADTISATLMKNAVATALTTTVTGAGTSNSDLVNSVAVVAGDVLTYKVISSATAAASRPRISTQFAPTINGESLGLISNVQTIAQSSTMYMTAGGGTGAAWGTIEAARRNIILGCSITKLNILATGIASGQTFAVTGRVNAASSSLTSTITGTATTGSDNTHSATVVDGDYYSTQGVTSATSGTVTPAIGFVMYVAPLASGSTMLMMGV